MFIKYITGYFYRVNIDVKTESSKQKSKYFLCIKLIGILIVGQ